MPSFEYQVELMEPNTTTPWRPKSWAELVRLDNSGAPLPWTAESAIATCHAAHDRDPGTQLRILRRRAAATPTSTRSIREGWLPYRQYRVDPDGIVRRTDR
jgi:hypothetical protein